MLFHRYNIEIENQQKQIIRLMQMANLENTKAFCEADYIGEREYIFDYGGMACKMLELLKNAVFPENSYQMQYLDRVYYEFGEKTPILFSKQELFDEGWLIACRGEWLFNISYKSFYESIDHLSSEKETQILSFLKELSKIPYHSQMRLRVSEQIKCEELEGVLTVKDGIAYIEPHGKYWLRYGNAIFGKWWDEIIETGLLDKGETYQQIERWFLCWNFFQRCSKPDCYCEHVGELFGICLKRLEEELENISWDLIEKIFRRKLYLENNQNGYRKYSDFMDDYPKTKIACILYIDNYLNFNLSEPPERLSQLYYLCLRQYGYVNIDYQIRFLKCIQNPWIYLNFAAFTAKIVNVECLIDCLEEPELYVVAAHAIWEKSYDIVTKIPSIGKKILEELDQNMFEIVDCKLGGENQEEWFSVVKDLSWYLNEQSSWYSKNTYMSKTGISIYMQHIHDDYMKWYVKNILYKNQLHNEVLKYFGDEFENCNERDIVKTFAGYAILLGMQCTEESSRKLFDALQKFLERVQVEDTLISVLSWSFWQEKFWIFMMRQVAENASEITKFLKLLEPEGYKEQVNIQRKENSALSRIGMAASILVYLMTILLIEGREETGKRNRMEIEKKFVEYILGVQIEQCDLFNPESVRLLKTEVVIHRCMEVMPMLNGQNQTTIMNEMAKKSPEKLIFLLWYVQNTDIRQKWIQILIQRIEEDFAKNIFCISTYMQIIDYLMEICFQGEDKEQKLTRKADELLGQFQYKIQDKGERIEKQYESWIQSAKFRIKLLKGEEQDILSDDKNTSSIFYKAFIYLNREDLESLKKAEQLYYTCISCKGVNANSASYINYFVACVRICTHEDISETEKREYIQKAENTAKEIRNSDMFLISNQKIFYINEMYLYTMLNDHLKFWKSASLLPTELKYDFSCARYVIQMLIIENENNKAEEYINELILRYGKTNEIGQLQRELHEKVVIPERNIPTALYNESSEIEKYRNALNSIKNLSEMDGALVRLQKNNLENPVEANLLEFVLNAVQQMGQYSDYLIYNSKTRNEDTYNKFVQILFNQRNKDIWDYYLKDQTFKGTAGDKLKSGFQSVGRIDLLICHKNDSVGIIETIKLQGTDYNNIQKHIQKIFGYNFANVSTAFLLILADMSKPGEFWEKYENSILPRMSEETKGNVWHFTGQTSQEDIELIKNGIVRKPVYLCMTCHVCDSTNQTLHLYHIMVDIQKAAAKKEAVDARKN